MRKRFRIKLVTVHVVEMSASLNTSYLLACESWVFQYGRPADAHWIANKVSYLIILNQRKLGAKSEQQCPQLLQMNPAGLCSYLNHGGSGLKEGTGNDVKEEEQATETEQPPSHIKDSASQQFRVLRTESFSFKMHAPQKRSFTTLTHNHSLVVYWHFPLDWVVSHVFR